MKKLFLTTLLAAFVGIQLFAQSSTRSILRIRLSDGGQFSATIDGRNYNRQGAKLTFGDLPPGRHSLRVFRLVRFDGIGRTRATLVYEGTVRLSPETFTLATVDVTRGTLNLHTNPIMYNSGNAGDRNDNRSNSGDNVHNYDRSDDVYSNNNDNYGDGNGRSKELTSRDLEDIQARIEKRITDTDKENLLKTALDGRTYATNQVATMMRMLSFESTKLDFAKWAYARVTDQRNYWKLEGEFSFSSTKEEFSNYIRNTR